MASTDVSINQLPETNQVSNGDYIIIQTPNATNRLDFSNFVVGLENTTFGSTIELHTTEISELSSSVETLSGTFYDSTPDVNAGQSTHSIPITINGVNYAILLSATS